MCGIIGYIGFRSASSVITEGLKHLEYRGYDSVGVAVVHQKKLNVRKDKGMVQDVSTKLDFTSMDGHMGIGHTRWATHGGVCKENAHPHTDCKKNVVLAHNGVIENFSALKADLASKGHIFDSETDTEIIAHLIEENMKNSKTSSFKEAFFTSLKSLEGSYALAAFAVDDSEERLFFARKNSPLVIGVGKDELLAASDIPAMLKYTKTFVPLEDGDVAILTKSGYKVYSLDGKEVSRKQMTVDWTAEMAQKGGYPYFMEKEINDQKHFINESLASDVTAAKSLIDQYENIHIIACGTSYHAGLMFSYLLGERGMSAQAYIASEYPYIVKPNKNTLVIAISQSGETADVLQALRYAKGCKKIAITNVVGSTITTIADCVVFINAGPEAGVAATKTFTCQLGIIYKIIYGKEKLESLSSLIEQMLKTEKKVKEIASALAKSENIFFIARGKNVPIAYEASLKLKEITYIHSEAYPGGELKHGPLSLISEGVPIIAIAPDDETLAKLFGNIKEAKSRGAKIISLTNNLDVQKESDFSIKLPELSSIDPMLYPFAMIIPLQLLAYHVSVLKGINPDRPRNLAKSLTVE
ncbi:glutamine--fructose-6-phosphate transaminase (isomerizing) [Candidatus Micrarchaeota archaeon]|nr:glutamine--fructose-6-phosphate transaminase (isomerizing) [Candidatus Micrarchaeota archaeon]